MSVNIRICDSQLSNCIANTSVVHYVNIQTKLLDEGWQECFNQPYSHHTTNSDLITSCPTTTASVPVGYESTSYSTYWYNYLPGTGNVRGFGFASDPTIDLRADNVNNVGWFSWDRSTINNADRLSWSYDNGGMRAGSVTPGENDNVYRKVVYWKTCPDTNSSTPKTPPHLQCLHVSHLIKLSITGI